MCTYSAPARAFPLAATTPPPTLRRRRCSHGISFLASSAALLCIAPPTAMTSQPQRRRSRPKAAPPPGLTPAATRGALAAKGAAYLGVALMPVTVSDVEIRQRDAEGFRGVRFHYMEHLGKGAPIDEVIIFAGRLAEIGWHLQIHMAANRIGELAPALRRSPVPVVIDHMGRIDASHGLEQEPFRNLLKLMEDPKVWVKVSGCDRATRQGPPYADAVPFARKLVTEFGDRCVWGTDFPHPNLDGPIPDDDELVDLLLQIAPKPHQ